MRTGAITFSLVASIPVALVAFASLVQWVPRFFDPCFEWGTARAGAGSTPGVRSGQMGSALSTASGPRPSSGQNSCGRRLSVTSETRAQAGTRLLIVPGGLLIASALGILGAMRSVPLLTIAGSAILALESIATIFTLAPITLLAALMLALAARQTNLAKRSLSGPLSC